MSAPRIALALSGGGAAALGHIPILETFDDLGIEPVAIAGASMGGIVGACYAAGLSGGDLRAHVAALADAPGRFARKLWGKGGMPGLEGLDGLAALSVALPEAVPDRFADLRLPLALVATDYHARAPLVLKDGDLRQALAASSAIPGVFRPVRINGKVCIDGGVVNNLPLDLLPDADLVIAVDAARTVPETSDEIPGPLEVVAGAMRIMLHSMMADTLEDTPGVWLVEPDSRRFGALDFLKADEILEAAMPAARQLRMRLEEHL